MRANYYPIQFAINRAFFHREITEQQADDACKIFKALCKIARIAKRFDSKNIGHAYYIATDATGKKSIGDELSKAFKALEKLNKKH